MINVSSIWSRDEIDTLTAVCGILLGIVISCFNIIWSNAYLITMGPLLVIVCFIYLIFRQKLLSPEEDTKSHPHVACLAAIFFWILVAASMYIQHMESLHRPLVYFISTSIAAGMIALQIFSSHGRGDSWLILIEILLLSLCVSASAYFVFPTLPGSDIWVHAEYVKDFVSLGRIESTRGWIYYLNYPITDLNSAIMNIITEKTLKTAMFLSVSLPLMLSNLFVFLICQRMDDIRAGLLAMLLVSLADFHLVWSIEPKSTTFGLILFAIILYLLIQISECVRTSTVILTTMLLLTMVIAHTMSAFVMFFLLVSFLIGMCLHACLYKERTTSGISTVNLRLTTMFGTAMLAYWIFADYTKELTFFEVVTRGLKRALMEDAGFLARPISQTAQYGYIDPILNMTGFLLLYFFGIIGCLLWLSGIQQTKIKVNFVIALLLMNAFAFSFPLFGMRNIMNYRWFSFIYVLLSVAAAAAIFGIIHSTNYKKLANVAFVCMVTVISFFMITNDVTNMDSPVYAAELNSRMVYTDSEMAIASKFDTVYEGRIVTDRQYVICVLETYMGKSNVSFNMLSENELDTGLVIWRDVMAKRPVDISNKNSLILGESFERKLEDSHNLIYNNNISKAFLIRCTSVSSTV